MKILLSIRRHHHFTFFFISSTLNNPNSPPKPVKLLENQTTKYLLISWFIGFFFVFEWIKVMNCNSWNFQWVCSGILCLRGALEAMSIIVMRLWFEWIKVMNCKGCNFLAFVQEHTNMIWKINFEDYYFCYLIIFGARPIKWLKCSCLRLVLRAPLKIPYQL
jgi:hypothetical protein